jgi:YD repeat-containing protein
VLQSAGVPETTKTTYDNEGNLITKVVPDEPNNPYQYTYDVANNVWTETDPNQEVTTNTYDTCGDLLSQTVGAEETTNVYDAFGDTLSTTDPDLQTTSYTVDAFGQDTGESQGGVVNTIPGGNTSTWSFSNLSPNNTGSFELYVCLATQPGNWTTYSQSYSITETGPGGPTGASLTLAGSPATLLGSGWYDLGSVKLASGETSLSISNSPRT